jgi:hypothetical protein
VLVLLSLVVQPVSQGFLQRMSGYTDMTIQSALLFLLDAGHIARIDRYHWQLSSRPSQLHLGVSLPEGSASLPELNLTPKISESSASQNPYLPADQTLTPKNSVSFIPESTVLVDDPETTQKNSESLGKAQGIVTPNNSESPELPEVETVPLQTTTPKNSDSLQQGGGLESEFSSVNDPSSSSLINLTNKDKQLLLKLGDSEKLRVEANLKECDEWGIKEPARTQISLAAHVDYILIRYHCSTLDESNRGLSIYRIKNGYRVDRKWLQSQGMKPVLKEALNRPQKTETEVTVPQDDWTNLLTSVESEFRRADFITWLKGGTVLVDQAEGEWTIGVVNSYTGKWVRERALAILEKAAGVRIKIVCNGSLVE